MPKAKNQAEVIERVEEVATPVAPQPPSVPKVEDKPKSESKSIAELMKKLIIVKS